MAASLLERHAECVVLELVPADPEPEAEAAITEQIELGRLLGQQRRLTLGPDEDRAGKGQVGAAGQVGEHQERFAEGVIDRVGTTEIAEHRSVPTEHVVVGRQVGVAEVCDRLPNGADGAAVTARFGLGENHADVHGCSLPARCWRSQARAWRRRRSALTLAPMLVRIFVEPQQGATYEQQARVAQAAEASGFDAFFRSDHFLTMGGDGLPGPTDAWITLGAHRP